MTLTNQDLKAAREQMQENLLCVLDGLPDDRLTDACQVIVDGMNELIKKNNPQ